MSYAVRNDRLGWRAVASEKDVIEGEHFSIEQPELAVPEVVLSCAKLQGELVLLEEPSPDPAYPTMLHWVEATVEAEQDPIRKRTMQAYLNAPIYRSDDPLVPVMWQAAGRDLSELPGVFARANAK